MKRISTVYIEAQILEQAQDKHINISQVAERGLREELNTPISQSDELSCFFCGRSGFKESYVSMPEKDKKALTWLCPDEKWICNGCLESKCRYLTISK